MSMRFIRRSVIWLSPVALLFLVLALAACGEGTPSGSVVANTNSGNASSASTSSANTSTSDNTAAETITITGPQNGTYVIDKKTISVKKGDLVMVVNQSNDDLDFDEGDVAKAGVDFIVPGHGSSPIVFNNPGTFAIKSKSGAAFTVTVDTAPASKSVTPALTLTISEPKAGTFAFDQPHISVKKGDMIVVVNHSSQDLDFDSGDAAAAGVDFIVAGSGSANVIFPQTGTFAIKSKNGASFTVTVS